MRVKYYDVCQQDFSTMYRVQYKQPKEWVFVCKQCLIAVKKDNPKYRYGGTWKKWYPAN